MGMYVPPYVKMKGAYGADQTDKVSAFRAERTVKVVPLELIELGKMGAKKRKKKWVLLELIHGDFTAAHTRTALIWEYPLRGNVTAEE